MKNTYLFYFNIVYNFNEKPSKNCVRYKIKFKTQTLKKKLCVCSVRLGLPHWLSGKDPVGQGMATHYSIPAWRVPWTEETEGLQSTGSQRVGHD